MTEIQTTPDKRLIRVLADVLWEKSHRREITEYWRHTADYERCTLWAAAQLRSIETAGYEIAHTKTLTVPPSLCEIYGPGVPHDH